MITPKVRKKLQRICGRDGVLWEKEDLLLYEYDASMDKALPDVVVLPSTARQVSEVVSLANEFGIPVVARGSGSNLSGGTIAELGGIVLQFSRMRRIYEINIADRYAVVEPGVYNLDLQHALSPYGFYYAPDPASQRVSTIGGNIAENAGGPHCLKYGVTANHVLGVEVVLSNGQIVTFGGPVEDKGGYDVTSVIVGSEGTLGIVTKAWLRIIPLPESVKTMLAVFNSLDDAASAVAAIIAAGIIPASLEMMDKPIIQTVESAMSLGYPSDADAILVIELDGPAVGMDHEAEKIVSICRQHGVADIRIAQTQEERDDFWKGRRASFGTLTQLRPSIMIADGTVPRSQLPEVLKQVLVICKKYNLSVGNVFHAGDGNLHPFILYDERNEEEKQRVLQATHEILETCVNVGGTISWEHGIGLEKKEAMKFLYSRDDMDHMKRLKTVFDPEQLLNPNKIFPTMEEDNL